ncbi:AraC-type DNA-binding protein [Halpernia humi]|uniref:AraC-type DNA-binding protein n=1 Tax=Halpernia humi TaxID=493375 RepID=A0A1H5Z940_9FLAO|nr:AraC family transcriptional regulator [Halpernia humi]SEG32878.1 AraC-type DNA-binding protein [Halpernia humi]
MDSSNNNVFEEKALLKRYFIHFHYVLLFILAFNILWLYLENNILYKTLFFAFVCDLFVVTVIYKLDFEIINPLVTPYLIVVFLFLWYFSLLNWNSNPATLFLTILFPFGTYTIFSRKVVIYWSIASALAIFLTIFFFNDLFSLSPPKENAAYDNIKTIVSFAIILGFIFYYNTLILKSKYNSKYKKRQDQNLNFSALSVSEISETDYEEKDVIFYNELFKQIEQHFKTTIPWKDANYNIQDLAYSLQTNSTYISRAINLNAKMNFNNFVNSYRIEFLKNEIHNKNYTRYKLAYLYSQAGFKHQSTFNRAFKKVTKMTPSEYLKNISTIKKN